MPVAVNLRTVELNTLSAVRPPKPVDMTELQLTATSAGTVEHPLRSGRVVRLHYSDYRQRLRRRNRTGQPIIGPVETHNRMPVQLVRDTSGLIVRSGLAHGPAAYPARPRRHRTSSQVISHETQKGSNREPHRTQHTTRQEPLRQSSHIVCPYRWNTWAACNPYTYTVSPDAKYTGPSTIRSIAGTNTPGTNS